MKPLSPLLYSKRNKKKVFASINSVMIAVSFLYVLYTFTQSLMMMQQRNELPSYNKAAKITNFENKPIESNLIKEIKQNENVERIVPTIFKYGIKYSIPGASDKASALPIRESDLDYFMTNQGIKLTEGRLPKEGLKEVALNKSIAENRKLKIGDKVGDSINKFDILPGEYVVVGIIESEPLISIVSISEIIYPDYKDEEKILRRGFYAFSKEGKKEAFDKYIEGLPEDKVKVITKSIAEDNFEKSSGALKVIDIIAILSIIVMVVTVGSSKYAQYYNRKEEMGVLNAIGYNKNKIISKTFKEVLLVNFLGFLIGIFLGTVSAYAIANGLWEPAGAKGFLFSVKGFVVSTFVPVFTILFSIIPINNLINRLDPIKMIEKN